MAIRRIIPTRMTAAKPVMIIQMVLLYDVKVKSPEAEASLLAGGERGVDPNIIISEVRRRRYTYIISDAQKKEGLPRSCGCPSIQSFYCHSVRIISVPG